MDTYTTYLGLHRKPFCNSVSQSREPFSLLPILWVSQVVQALLEVLLTSLGVSGQSAGCPGAGRSDIVPPSLWQLVMPVTWGSVSIRMLTLQRVGVNFCSRRSQDSAVAGLRVARLLESPAQQSRISHLCRVPPLRAGHGTSPDSSVVKWTLHLGGRSQKVTLPWDTYVGMRGMAMPSLQTTYHSPRPPCYNNSHTPHMQNALTCSLQNLVMVLSPGPHHLIESRCERDSASPAWLLSIPVNRNERLPVLTTPQRRVLRQHGPLQQAPPFKHEAHEANHRHSEHWPGLCWRVSLLGAQSVTGARSAPRGALVHCSLLFLAPHVAISFLFP